MVRTRIVCVSDTHSYSPADAAFKLPKGDVLIHAGDLTKHGTLAQLRRTVEWIEKADFEVKIVIAGTSPTLTQSTPESAMLDAPHTDSSQETTTSPSTAHSTPQKAPRSTNPRPCPPKT